MVCHDDETTWFDWGLLKRHQDVLFVKEPIALGQGGELAIERANMTLNELLAQNYVEWHGVRLNAADSGPESHGLGATIQLGQHKLRLNLMVSAYWEPLRFELPPGAEGYFPWRCRLDTALDAPNDVCALPSALEIDAGAHTVQPRSIVLLLSQPKGQVP